MKNRAYAKINLCLDVVRRKEDGYHELKMVMVPINFYDVLEMLPANETTLSVNRTYLPVNDKNTVIKAIHVMQKRYHIKTEYECNLVKHIPTQAGLAGGSADAAAAIRMINQMEHLRLTYSELIEVGKEVGADVPFCIMDQPALAEGIGEILKPFAYRCPFEFLLVKPKRGVSTAAAFQGLDFSNIVHPDCDAMVKALENNDYEAVIANLGNSLEEISCSLVEEIREVKEGLKEVGFDGVLMSGSGSTVFGITRDHDLVERASDMFRKQGYFVRRTNILNSID